MSEIRYIFDEEKLLKELKEYIDGTYQQHYSKMGQGGIQTTEFIMSHLDSFDFFKGNALKYVTRYGYKDGHQRKDILKAIHYLLLMLCYHDRKYGEKIEGPKGPRFSTVRGFTIEESWDEDQDS